MAWFSSLFTKIHERLLNDQILAKQAETKFQMSNLNKVWQIKSSIWEGGAMEGSLETFNLPSFGGLFYFKILYSNSHKIKASLNQFKEATQTKVLYICIYFHTARMAILKQWNYDQCLTLSLSITFLFPFPSQKEKRL